MAIQNRALDTLMRLYFAFPDVRFALANTGPLKTLGLEDPQLADCEAKDSPHETVIPAASRFIATSEGSVSAARCFNRQFPANVLARSQSFRLVATEVNLN